MPQRRRGTERKSRVVWLALVAAPEPKMTISRRRLIWGAAAAAAAGAPRGARAQSAAETFFRGKTIRLLVGTTPGAGYDLVARLLAAHLGGHVPGNPAIVVENMAGAGSLTITNYRHNRAPRDGH